MAKRKSSHPLHIKMMFFMAFLLFATIVGVGLSQANLSMFSRAAEKTPSTACTNYVYDSKWGTQGTGNGQFNYPQKIAVDQNGNVFVADTSNHRVQKFDANGNYILQWGAHGSGNGQFNYAYGITTDASGNVYVADGDGTHTARVQKFTNNGQYITYFGSLGTGDGQFIHPLDIAHDSSGNFYVTDGFLERVQKFNSQGVFITKWQPVGTPRGPYTRTSSIAVSGNKVFVGDMNNALIQVFDLNGNFISQFGGRGSGNGQFDVPSGITGDQFNRVLVADTNVDIHHNNRIQVFSNSADYQFQWGSAGSNNGQFIDADGLVVSNNNDVYVADTVNNRIQKFTCVSEPTATPTPIVTSCSDCGLFSDQAGACVEACPATAGAGGVNQCVAEQASCGNNNNCWRHTCQEL